MLAPPIHRALASRALASLALALVGCGAMSVGEYDKLSEQVAQRNEARRLAAQGAFRARGYEPVADMSRYAVLEDESRERCIQARNTPTAPEDAEPVRIRVTTPTPAGADPSPALELSAPRDEACAFFEHRTDRLEAVRATGEPVHVVRIPDDVGFARDPTGEIVYVQPRFHVVSRRTVRIERTCNEMPSPPPDPLEHMRPSRVVLGPAPTRTVPLDVDREYLDYECTEVVE